jgi:hypothetical protein
VLDPRFVVLGALCSIAGSARYVAHTLRGTTVPNRVTWALWAVAPLMAFTAELSKGVGLAALLTLTIAFGPAVIFAASFTKGAAPWRPSRFDITCGVLSVAGLVAWRLTGDGNAAIALGLAADAMAAVPTVTKAIRAPETESYSVFLGGSANATITLLTIHRWTFASAAWPIYIAVVGSTLALLIRFRSAARSPAPL